MNSIWYSIIIVGVLTYFSRLSFILISDRIQIHPQIFRAFKFIPIAVLAGIIIPEVFQKTDIQNSISFPRLIAGVIAIFVAWKTKNVILTITVGMATLYFIQFLGTI